MLLPRPAEARVRGRPSRRPLLHPHEQGREELPRRHRPGRRPVALGVEGPDPPPARGLRRRDRRLPRLPRRLRARGGPAARRRARPGLGIVAAGHVPGAGLQRRPRPQPRFRPRPASASAISLSLLLRSVYDFDPEDPVAGSSQADGGPRRLRPVEVHERVDPRDGLRRDEDSDQPRLPEGRRHRRPGAAAPVRLRVVRVAPGRRVQRQPREPARPGRDLRPGPHPRRRRPRRALARRRQDDAEEEHLHRLHRRGRRPRRPQDTRSAPVGDPRRQQLAGC